MKTFSNLVKDSGVIRMKRVMVSGDENNWYYNIFIFKKVSIFGIPYKRLIAKKTFSTPRYSNSPKKDNVEHFQKISQEEMIQSLGLRS